MITAMPRVAIATRDFDGIVAAFRDTLGMPVVDVSAGTVASLGAKLAMCVPSGGSNIELMSPADPDAPLSRSLQRFLARRGDGLFALMLEAPDPDAEAEVLRERGLDVLPLMAGAGGRDVHPRSTHGVLIRVYPNDSFRAESGQTQRNEARALGLSGVARVVIAVRDAKQACETYGRRLGLATRGPASDAERGVTSVVCEPAKGGRIDLVEPADSRRPFAAAVEQHVRQTGEGLFALVLQARDPGAAGAALLQRGIAVGTRQAGAIEIAPGSLFGTRVMIERVESA